MVRDGAGEGVKKNGNGREREGDTWYLEWGNTSINEEMWGGW